jgi:4a-hydroxytetrahydrobiopterin dehydratase
MNQIHGIPLSELSCEACEGGIEAIGAGEMEKMLGELGDKWTIVDGHHLFRKFGFKNFQKALEFTNRVGALAEEEGHHPDILVGWGKAEVTMWTHAVNGLTLNDFILASKISAIRSKGR